MYKTRAAHIHCVFDTYCEITRYRALGALWAWRRDPAPLLPIARRRASAHFIAALVRPNLSIGFGRKGATYSMIEQFAKRMFHDGAPNGVASSAVLVQYVKKGCEKPNLREFVHHPPELRLLSLPSVQSVLRVFEGSVTTCTGCHLHLPRCLQTLNFL